MNGQVTNPSAVAWRRIKQIKENPMQAKQDFLENVLDDRAKLAFSKLPPESQARVLSEMDLAGVRNPSAFLWTRIKALGGEMPTGTPRGNSGIVAGRGNGIANMLDAKVQ